MTAEPPIAEQSKGELVLATVGGAYVLDINEAILVRIHHTDDFHISDDVKLAMRDPANVMKVSAFSEVVKVCERAVQYVLDCGPGTESTELFISLTAALSLVHPAEEDKT